MSRKMIRMDNLIDEISMGPFGSDIKVDCFVESGIPVLNGSNLSSIKLVEQTFKYVTPEKAKSLKKANAKRGDIIITHRGTLGQISYIPNSSKYENYVISQSQFRVSLKSKMVDPAYFVYFFHTNEGQKRLLANKSYVGVPALAQATSNFRLIDFPLIPLEKQQKIASILSALDAKIELNNRINVELEAMAKTLYDYWFVQFDFPDKSGKPYKSAGGKMVYNATLKREIPEGWEAGNILKIASLLGGGTPSKKENAYWSGDIPFFTPSDADDNIFKLQTADNITEVGLKNCSSKLFEKGTIFITARGSVGKIAIVAINMAMNQSCYALKPNKNVNYAYLYYCTQHLTHYLKVKSSGSVFNSIVSNDINLTPIAIPPINLIEQFGKTAIPMFEKILTNTKQNQQLAQLRDWLLPMLMNGQVKIKE